MAQMDAIETLFRSGHYGRIVNQCDFKAAALSELTDERRMLIAYVAWATGNLPEADELAQRENKSTASSGIRSRCEVVLGLVRKRQADWNSAVKHFQLGSQLAKEAGDAKQSGWASLWLFRALAETRPIDGLAAMLNDVRRTVARTGDPHLIAFMHDSMALMEASAGRLQEARRHVNICARLLDQNPHAWLQQLSLISKFFVDYLDCKYAEALRNLQGASALCDLAGSGLSPVIDCNEGHLQIILGRFASAERSLLRVAASTSREFALGSLEGLARLYLLTDRLAECEQALGRYDSLAVETTSAASAFARRWTVVTAIKLWIRKGMFSQAADEAERYLQLATPLDDQLLIGALNSLRAEALSKTGSTQEAARSLAHLALNETFTTSAQGEFYRTLGSVLSHINSTLSRATFERSLAVWDHQGNAGASRELRDVIAKSESTTGRSSFKPVAADVPLRLTTAFAAAFNLAHSSQLLGRELINVIEELKCSPNAQLVSKGRPIVNGGANECVLALGDDRGKQIALVCEIPPDPVKAIILADVMRIGKAARALERARQRERSQASLWPVDPVVDGGDAIFVAEETHSLLATARRVATTNVPVLITGETGTGKEVLARTIHAYSTRAKRAFIPFNCTSTPRDMLDSQLFGHRRGSFTGAMENFQGIIRAAAAGTLFLDEIGDMPLEVQPKLLRFLEAGEVHPIGETQPVHADVRVIAATNANLDALVTDGRFREDLFYRLNIVRLHVPALRERRVEIPALANHYLQKYAQEYGKGDLRLAEETMEYLLLYRWPGNVRQLANEVRRMAALGETGAVLMPEHLSPDIAASRRTVPPSERVLDQNEVVVRLDQPMAAATEHLERAMLQYALDKAGGHMEETAALLGLSRKGLYLKRQRFGIDPPGEIVPAVGMA